MTRLMREQRSAVLERIPPGFVRQLIDEGLHEESVPGRLDAAPGAGGDGTCELHRAVGLVRHGVDNVRLIVGLIYRGVVVHPCQRCAVSTQRAPESARYRGAVVIVLDVIFSCEYELDRDAWHGHCRPDGILEEIPIVRQPPTEGATARQLMKRHLAHVQ